jgi:hypothetical protein
MEGGMGGGDCNAGDGDIASSGYPTLRQNNKKTLQSFVQLLMEQLRELFPWFIFLNSHAEACVVCNFETFFEKLILRIAQFFDSA